MRTFLFFEQNLLQIQSCAVAVETNAIAVDDQCVVLSFAAEFVGVQVTLLASKREAGMFAVVLNQVAVRVNLHEHLGLLGINAGVVEGAVIELRLNGQVVAVHEHELSSVHVQNLNRGQTAQAHIARQKNLGFSLGRGSKSGEESERENLFHLNVPFV